jgi:hypothetical protein
MNFAATGAYRYNPHPYAPLDTWGRFGKITSHRAAPQRDAAQRFASPRIATLRPPVPAGGASPR